MWHAWAAFRKGKKLSREILVFEGRLEYNLLRLCVDLNTGRYKHGLYNSRIVNEKKRRDIAVASVRDRVVHRLLYDYLVPLVDHRLDYDVWSCRPGKGLHSALDRTQRLTNTYSAAWFWRADVSKFFDNVNHEVLNSCLRRLADDKTALELLDEVIGSYYTYAPGVGIPIGNLTSQIFANIYLNEFDRFVRHTIKPYAYIRYGDDFLMFLSEDQAFIVNAEATQWLHNNLGLTVHKQNNITNKTGRGIFFLGHKIYPHSPLSVDNYMLDKILAGINLNNLNSYESMHIPHRKKKLLPWLM